MREAEWATAKRLGGVSEKEIELIEETRLGIWWGLNEDQYLDSGVCERVLGFGFSLGFTGKLLEIVILEDRVSSAIVIVRGAVM